MSDVRHPVARMAWHGSGRREWSALAAIVRCDDRVAEIARAKMDSLLVDQHLPEYAILQGAIDRSVTGGAEAGWRARVTPFERPAGRAPGTPVLERIELEIWWTVGDNKRTFSLDAFRRKLLLPEDAAAIGQYSP